MEKCDYIILATSHKEALHNLKLHIPNQYKHIPIVTTHFNVRKHKLYMARRRKLEERLAKLSTSEKYSTIILGDSTAEYGIDELKLNRAIKLSTISENLSITKHLFDRILKPHIKCIVLCVVQYRLLNDILKTTNLQKSLYIYQDIIQIAPNRYYDEAFLNYVNFIEDCIVEEKQKEFTYVEEQIKYDEKNFENIRSVAKDDSTVIYPDNILTNQEIIKSIVNECESRKIKLIILLPPLHPEYIKGFNSEVYQKYKSFLKSFNNKYYEVHDHTEFYVNLPEVFFDPIHLNFQGKIIWTNELMNIIN